MRPPESLTRALKEYDPGLNVRWAESVGQWCVERRHGFVGHLRDAVLAILHSRWKQLEREAAVDRSDLDLELRERLAYDDFIARRAGYQPILYLRSDQAECGEAILLILFGMDIRRAGGPAGWAARYKDAQERHTRVIRAQRRERLRELAERAYDHAAAQKDFHAQGGDAYFYPWDKSA